MCVHVERERVEGAYTLKGGKNAPGEGSPKVNESFAKSKLKVDAAAAVCLISKTSRCALHKFIYN